jgi:hypothetical protein
VARALTRKVKTGNQREDSGNECVRAEKRDESDERDPRPNQGDDAKDDPGHSSETE